MRTARDPFGEALDWLRRRLRSGELGLGGQLMAAPLARQMGLSTTPVREALSRLAGEGLIEDRPGSGYFAWRMDAVDLCDLYGLQGTFMASAIQGGFRSTAAPPGPSAGDGSSGDPYVIRVEAFHARLIARGANLALVRVNRLLSDRLAPARGAEVHVLDDVEAELSQLLALEDGADMDVLIAALDAYQTARVRAATAIIGAMRSLARSADAI